MELEKKEAELVDKMIRTWEQEQKISVETAKNLRGSYTVRNANLDAVALYAVIAAISCGLLAFGALVIDEKWIELLRKKWGFSELIVGIGFTLLSVLFVILAKRRQEKFRGKRVSNEAYYIAITLTIGIAITYWTRSFASPDSNYALPIFFAAVAYGSVAIFLRSTLLWTFMILALAGWWGAQTYYWSGGSFRFLGMNYPLRMTLFGLIIWGLSMLLSRVEKLGFAEDISYSLGLLLFLIAAWTLSIFGNYDDLTGWKMLKQSHFWYWALAFTLVLGGMLYYAFVKKLDTMRDLCLVFFLINIYTRYFEYFWDRTNKGLFFALLAISFWFVARKAEQWRQAASH